MIEADSMEFVTAIIFITAMIVVVVGMYAYHLVISGQRLKKAQRLADAAIEFTPAFMTIVFDERERVAILNVQDTEAEGYFQQAVLNKQKDELSFLPLQLRKPEPTGTNIAGSSKNSRPTAPLKMPNGKILYLEWEMQGFKHDDNKTELQIARGYDITTQLLQTQQKLQALSATSSEVEERERKRIAEELHDRIGEILMTSTNLLDELKKDSPSSEYSHKLEALDQTIDNFTRGARSLIFDLIPPELYDVGLAGAVESLAAEFGKKHNISIQVRDVSNETQVNPEIAMFLYKAVREFIMNASVHGGADEMLVSLNHVDHTLEVTVEDNGSGFMSGKNSITLSTESGFGLFNVKTRAEYYRGNLDISDSPDLGGGIIKVWVPHPQQQGEKLR